MYIKIQINLYKDNLEFVEMIEFNANSMCGSSLNKPKKEFTLSKFMVRSLMILAIQNCLVGLRLDNENLSPF